MASSCPVCNQRGRRMTGMFAEGRNYYRCDSCGTAWVHNDDGPPARVISNADAVREALKKTDTTVEMSGWQNDSSLGIGATVPAKRGDHICAIYSTAAELARTVARFLAEGLSHHERCWYVASGDEGQTIRAFLEALDVDVEAEIARGALNFISADEAYVIHGAFDPVATTQVFNDAIEQAYSDGFTGFRAAAEMSWVLQHEDRMHLLIVYEALLRSLFATCRAIGLCLYDRHRMPLDVINGALQTHPCTVTSASGGCRTNPFYDSAVDRLLPADEATVMAKLKELEHIKRS